MGLRDRLRGFVPVEVLPYVPDRFEIIGDIAILALPRAILPFRHSIAETVVAHRKNIHTVLNRTGPVDGPGRTARYETLLGQTTETIHREFGYAYHLDIRHAFFSPRLANERRRVCGLVRPGERVCVPFAGVGPFAIPSAARGADVNAVELNPDAYRYLAGNVILNHGEGACHPVPGNALDCPHLQCRGYDRLIIPAPYGMDHSLDLLLPLLAGGGTAHFYTFSPREQVPDLVREYEGKGLTVTLYRSCGSVAPGISRWVFDLVVPPET